MGEVLKFWRGGYGLTDWLPSWRTGRRDGVVVAGEVGSVPGRARLLASLHHNMCSLPPRRVLQVCTCVLLLELTNNLALLPLIMLVLLVAKVGGGEGQGGARSV